METKTKKLITAKMLINQIVLKYPKSAKMLVAKYGFHCIGCAMGAMETLEQGAAAHGMTKKQIGKMIDDLNQGDTGK
ncbi:MAG: DUF1858 domain-containing protein, partial [Candidatus Shapirobacteria bacterium]